MNKMSKKFIKNLSKAFKSLNKDLKKNIDLKQLSGGVTNKIYLAHFENNQKYIIRECGNHTENFIDRDLELRIINELKPYNISRIILKQFNGGYIESYVEGRPLNLQDFKCEKINKILGKRLNELHSLNILNDLPKNPTLWSKIDLWYEQCIELYKNDENLKEMIEYIGQEIKIKKEEQKSINSPIIFCHNDLTAANMIYQNENDIKFIDFEYASYNYRGFDIANLFCEHTGNHCKWELFPTNREQQSFYQHYVKHSLTPIDINTLEKEVRFYIPISFLFWSVWGLLQNKHSNVDFYFLEYAKQRLIGYNKYKNI